MTAAAINISANKIFTTKYKQNRFVELSHISSHKKYNEQQNPVFNVSEI